MLNFCYIIVLKFQYALYGFQIGFEEHTKHLTSCKMLPFDLIKFTYFDLYDVCIVCLNRPLHRFKFKDSGTSACVYHIYVETCIRAWKKSYVTNTSRCKLMVLVMVMCKFCSQYCNIGMV